MTSRSERRDAALRRVWLTRASFWRDAQARLEALRATGGVEAAEASRIAEDYRAIASDLATSRRIAPQSRTREYLESLYSRAHGELHRGAIHPGYAFWSLLRDQLPATVDSLRVHIAWVTALFLLSAGAGWWMVSTYPELARLFASQEMITTVERGKLWTDGLLNVTPSSVLSVQILTNNIVVSLFAYSAGFLFGLGTLYIIGINGLMLGSVFAFTAANGLDGRLFEFIVAHGVVELSCICLSGAAGAAVGESLIRPGTARRRDAFAAAARRTLPLLVAIVLLLLGCGFIEGYVSPNPDMPLAARIVIGFGYFLFMVALLRGWVAGRSRGSASVD
jgi:uncharacterized membrane protein SpoIIM required for sporulation